MPDEPHYIPPAERAEGEPGEGGCLRAEAEELEAAQSAPEILEAYRAEAREAEEAANPPPDQPWPTQAAADLMALGKWPSIPSRKALEAHFNLALRQGRWICYGFSEDEGRRVPVRSPWLDRRHTYAEVLFYGVGAKPGATNARADEGATNTKKSAPTAADMITWLDGLPIHQRKKKPNALADLYLSDPNRRGSKRYACTVFANPDKYRKQPDG